MEFFLFTSGLSTAKSMDHKMSVGGGGGAGVYQFVPNFCPKLLLKHLQAREAWEYR